METLQKLKGTSSHQVGPKSSKKKTEEITGSAAVLEALMAENVDTIFGYPGGADHADL